MKRLIKFLFGRKLKNKAGGMAWIKGMDDNVPGASALNGRAVKTVKVAADGKWLIEPLQQFTAADNFRWNGAVYLAGATVTVLAIVDECLEPWKPDAIDEEEVSELFAPAPQLTNKEVQT
jgi:hypothetical protein